jgi:DNA-binding protein HU-beta
LPENNVIRFTFNQLINKIMNKTELIEKIAAGAGLSKADAKKALDATTTAIKGALAAGDKIQLVGFGTFSVTERSARQGINPATKAKINIAAKKIAKFKAGAELADAIK